MHKISRRNFLMTCGKTAGGLAAMTAFGGCASPEQAENGLFGSPSALPVKTDDRLAGIDAIVQDYMNQGYFPGAALCPAGARFWKYNRFSEKRRNGT